MPAHLRRRSHVNYARVPADNSGMEADTNVQAGTTTTFVYGLALISATDGSGNTSFYLPDGLGSTSQLTNSAGSVTDRYAYDAFGAMRSQSGATANDWRFTGQQNDQNANRGLYDLRARMYDPTLGRFLQRDSAPIRPSLPQSLDPYPYVTNNPANFVDASGLWCPKDPGDCVPSPVKNVAGAAVDHVQRLATLNCLSFGLSAVALGVAIAFPETATAINAVSAGWFLTFSGPVWTYAVANNVRTLAQAKENGVSKGLAATGLATDAFAYLQRSRHLLEPLDGCHTLDSRPQRS
ncbi:MAG TPA: RHS repeat-associated core domain-containing protein [Mycobacterium sp.]|nr:RHS repeat-associated core domain-containing protein [Mycobacterium sp.]